MRSGFGIKIDETEIVREKNTAALLLCQRMVSCLKKRGDTIDAQDLNNRS